MSAAARRPSNAAALRAHYRTVQARLTAASRRGSASPEGPASPPRSARATPVEVMVFSRDGWEGPLAEMNEHLRALFAVGRASEHELIDMVAAHFRLTRAEMVGARGSNRVVQARHIAIYMCRREFGASAGALGLLFRRDHTSVIHAAQKVAARIDRDPALAAEVAALAACWRDRCA